MIVVQSWKEWFEEQQAVVKMSARVIFLSRVLGWQWLKKVIKRIDGAFFQVVGVRVKALGAQNGVMIWDQPMIRIVGQGAIILFHTRDKNFFLIQAKTEPGNASYRHVLLAPTIQASYSNLRGLHGGKKPPRIEFLSPQMRLVGIRQDGGCFYLKVNKYGFVEIGSQSEIDLLPNERWFTRQELAQAVAIGCANEHLVQSFGLMNAREQC